MTKMDRQIAMILTAWHTECLNNLALFVCSRCMYRERRLSDGFNGSNATRTGYLCRDEPALSNFGGNNILCGAWAFNGFASPEFELRHWNVIAQRYCERVQTDVLEQSYCDSTIGTQQYCDAPAIICVDDESGIEEGVRCNDFGVFLNGHRQDNLASGLVSRNLELNLYRNDYFEIDTMVRRFTRELLSRIRPTSESHTCIRRPAVMRAQ